MPSVNNQQQTLFRPSVVSSYSSSTSTSFRAKALHAFSYVAAVFVFAAMLTEEFPVGSSGRHSLSGIQESFKGFYEYAITGTWPEPIQRKKVDVIVHREKIIEGKRELR